MKTSRTIIAKLKEHLVEEFTKQIAQFGVKGKQREALISGFTDGVTSGIRHTLQMLEVEVTDD